MIHFLTTTTVILLCLIPYTIQQMGLRMRLDTPRTGQAIELASFLFEDEESEGMSIRKDCRLLEDEELQEIFDAIREAKEDTTARPNVLDAFSFLHSHPEVNTVAHTGIAFLPFHRVYLYLYEKLLRQYRPGISLCYWDPTYEPEDFEQSDTWSPSLFGSARGLVVDGFAANWITPMGPLIRQMGSDGRTLNEDDIKNVLNKKRLGEISFPNGRMSENVEELHNHVHLYIGGLMAQIETAAYDPIFWFYHVFIDCLYEEFRENQRNNNGSSSIIDPEADWPADYGDDRQHGPFAPMRLGALRNIDGQNNFFSNRIQCEKIPSCRSDRDCGTYMNCRNRRCISNRRSRTRTNPNVFGGTMGIGGLMGPQNPNPLMRALSAGGLLGAGFPGMNNVPGMQGIGGGFPGFGGAGRGSQQGPTGIGGSPGFPGMGGPQGFPGMGGAQGFPGMGGAQGFPGMGGAQVFPGMGGAQGFPGMGGGQGFPGMGGAQGFPGMGGMNGMSSQSFFGGGGPQSFPGMGGMQGFPGFGK